MPEDFELQDPPVTPVDPPQDPPAEPDLREEVKRLNEINGRTQQDNATLRQRLDALELSTHAPARPSTTQPGDGEPDFLEKYVMDGFNAEELEAPWTSTLVKAIKRVAPVFRDVARAEAVGAQGRAQVDDDFYGYCLEKQGKPVTPRTVAQFRRKYGTVIGDLSKSIVQLPDGRVRSEYAQDFTRSFEPVYEALARRNQELADDDFRPAKSQERAPVGDRGGGGRAPARQQPGKKQEVGEFVKEMTSI